MAISAHHINNVLRVYGDQIRQSMISDRPEDIDTNALDRIGISANSRRETIIDDITSNIIERIAQSRPHDNIEKEIFKTIKSEHEKPLVINKDCHGELIFKEIDSNGETIHSLSIKDSKFLTNNIGNHLKKP